MEDAGRETVRAAIGVSEVEITADGNQEAREAERQRDV
jgi:hypothetical protein